MRLLWGRRGPGARIGSLSGLLAATFVIAACGPSAERIEAARVLRSIEQVRATTDKDAPEERLRLVEALEREPAVTQAAQTARSRCAAAYRALFEGKALLADAERRMPKASDEAILDVARTTAAAEAKLSEARAAMDGCANAAGVLRRQAGE